MAPNWLVDYLVAPTRGEDGSPPADAERVTMGVTAENAQGAKEAARIQIMRQFPSEVKWERETRPARK